jgi:hypothetical protein
MLTLIDLLSNMDRQSGYHLTRPLRGEMFMISVALGSFLSF